MDQADRLRLPREKYEFYTWIRLNFNAVFFAVIFLCGVFIGSAAFRALELDKLKIVENMLYGIISERENKSTIECFFSILFPNMLAWGFLLICGLCAISAPIVFFTALFRGMGCALTTCAVFAAYEDPFYYIFKYLFADYALGTIAVILCCCEAVSMSRQLFNAVVMVNRKKTSEISSTVFLGKMLLFALLMVLGAAVQTYFIGR